MFVLCSPVSGGFNAAGDGGKKGRKTAADGSANGLPAAKKPRTCSICHTPGHTRTTCPQRWPLSVAELSSVRFSNAPPEKQLFFHFSFSSGRSDRCFRLTGSFLAPGWKTKGTCQEDFTFNLQQQKRIITLFNLSDSNVKVLRCFNSLNKKSCFLCVCCWRKKKKHDKRGSNTSHWGVEPLKHGGVRNHTSLKVCNV